MTCPHLPCINASVTHAMSLFVYCSYTNRIITMTASYLSLRITSSRYDISISVQYNYFSQIWHVHHIYPLWHTSQIWRDSICPLSLGLYMTWYIWLRHCATSRKVAGSIPDGFIGICHWHNPSGRTMALRLTQPLTEMSNRSISWR